MIIYVTRPDGTTAYEVCDKEARVTTILQFLIDHKLRAPETPCGGRGSCHKCKLTIQLGMQRLQVLACRTPLRNGMQIYLPKEVEHRIALTGNCSRYPAEAALVGAEEFCTMAVDIGTTTVVSYLLCGRAGEIPRIAAVESGPNAQRIYGADVMSRIQAAGDGNLQKQTDLIRDQIHAMQESLIRKAGILERVSRLAIVGNTVMCHLFAGISPESIGEAPFLPASDFGSDEGGTYIAPAVSGFIGGDIVADLLAVEAEKKIRPWLLLDIGTNGEMVLGAEGKWYACSAAAGPAFEGAMIKKGMPAMTGAICKVNEDLSWEAIGIGNTEQAKGICGSGLIDLIAVLLKKGILDESGLLKTESGKYYLTPEVYVDQEDVRQIQLAKAAVAAGIRVLCRESRTQIKNISEVVLAGGFGSALNCENAADIGLIPAALRTRTEGVGNAAGEGAISLAVSETARRKAQEYAGRCHYVELSGREDFMDWFVEEINFPKMDLGA